MIAEEYTPEHLNLWRYPEHYFGPSHKGYYVFPECQNRDSDCLTRSNYRVALARLEKLNTEIGEGESTVYDVRDSHFLCGWIEYILIHRSNEKALRAADEMVEALALYPVLCEDDWSNLESEEEQEAWEGLGRRSRIAACAYARISIFAARRKDCPSDDQGSMTHYLLYRH